jgi:hypothetical protein
MDGSNRTNWLGRLRAISSVLVLTLAVALSLWTLLLRFAPDDGSEFERRSDIVGGICAGVHGTCESDQYQRLKRDESLPWLGPSVAVGLAGMLLAWPRRPLHFASVGVVLLGAFVALRVLPVPPEPAVLTAKRTLIGWIEAQPVLRAHVLHIDMYQEERGFTIGIWTEMYRDAEDRSIAEELARRVPSVVEAVHVFVIGNSRGGAILRAPLLARWDAPGAPPSTQRPHYSQELVPKRPESA